MRQSTTRVLVTESVSQSIRSLTLSALRRENTIFFSTTLSTIVINIASKRIHKNEKNKEYVLRNNNVEMSNEKN